MADQIHSYTTADDTSTSSVEEIDQMTEEGYVKWCDEEVRSEYIDGRVIIMSPESVRDERLRWFIGTILQVYVEHHDLGEVFGPNLQMRLRPGLRRIPDLVFLSRHRLHLLEEAHFEGPPDLAMEIVSPDSRYRDEQEKHAEYETYGIREYWVIALLEKRVDLHYLTDEEIYEPLSPTSGVYHSTVIPGFFLNPEWLWRQPLPKKRDILRELGL